MLTAIIWLCYKYWISAYRKWEKRGIPYIPGIFPFGSDSNLTTYRKSAGFVFDDMYKKTTLHPYFGVYIMRTNVLVLRDPDIIRLVLSKAFSNFMDRTTIKLSEKDYLTQHLFFLKGEKWRELRTKLAPAFSREKLKYMFPLFIDCAENFNGNLLSKLNSTVDVKDIAAQFNIDAICSCAFGLDIDTYQNKNHKLLKMFDLFMSTRFHSLVRKAAFRTFPGLNSILPTRLTPEEIEVGLVKIVEDTIQFREKFGLKRNDFIDLLIRLKHTGSIEDTVEKDKIKNAHFKDISIGTLAAQCFVFFLASYETSSSLQTCCLYELAFHQNIQHKLYQEIYTVIKKHGSVTLDAIEEMEYLEMVLKETMRKYPTIPYLLRACTKEFTMPAGHIIKKGESIFIPVWSLHHDSHYFPNPHSFDPERFSPENKKLIRPFTYLPFGEGERSCIDMFLLLIFFGTAFWIFYKYYTSVYSHWESKGIPTEPGKFPFGHDINLVTLIKFQGHILDKVYKKYESHPYVGYYVMRTPLLLIRDPEIIRLVLAKEFTHFRDRNSTVLPKNDVLMQHLFNLDGDKWRALRVKLSPTFTSGKLKAMFPLFLKCSEDLTNMLITQNNKETDIKDITARYTTDTICSCAFGLDNNSIRDDDNAMRKIGNEIMTKTVKGVMRLALTKVFPQINKYLSIRALPIKIEEMLMKTVGDTIEYREKNNIKRNDFLDLLMQLKNKGTLGDDLKEANENIPPIEMDLGMLTAQSFVFFVAGFETSSSVQSYCLYELALNQDIQKKLIQEIDETIEKHGGITYQAIQEMEYLSMVISETMRMYPTVPTLTRSCTQSFTMPDGHKLLKGDRIVIPLWSLQHDPKYFPNPEKFDPERFSTERKASIVPFTYMPFGEGPRICIGLRFGLLQTKMGLITILRKFRVEKSEKTAVPLEFSGSNVIAMTNGPIILQLTPRIST